MTRPKPIPDPELAALASIHQALDPLTCAACARVLAWASARYAGPITPIPPQPIYNLDGTWSLPIPPELPRFQAGGV